MSTRKKCKLFHCGILRSLEVRCEPVDWSLCALCQERSEKTLNCLVKSKCTDIGYDILANNLNSFLKLGIQPLSFDTRRLDEEDGIGNTLARNHAQWHTSCRLKWCVSCLARVELASLSSKGDSTQEGAYMLRER